MQRDGIACHVPFVMTMYERHCNIEGNGQAKAGMSRHHLLRHSTAQHSTAQHSTAQHSTAQLWVQ